jgi:hypothetical protein
MCGDDLTTTVMAMEYSTPLKWYKFVNLWLAFS